MPQSSCSGEGPIIARNRATGRRSRAAGVSGGLRGVCVCAQHKAEAEAEAGRGGRRMAKEGDDSPFPSGLSASTEERTHNRYG